MSIFINDKDKKTYVILGAPHSATSFVSKALSKLGISMTRKNQEDTRYFKHYYQDEEFVKLNKKILRSIPGGRWNTPPKETEIITTGFEEEIKKLLKSRQGQPFWGWKDTRTSLTIKKYLPYLSGDVYLICIFRKPRKVLKSYIRQRRQRKLNWKGLKQYNKAIIEAIKEFCKL